MGSKDGYSLSVRQRKDQKGRSIVVFDCDDHSGRGPVVKVRAHTLALCSPSLVESRVYLCGKSVVCRDPRSNTEDGCPEGLQLCDECAEVFGRFLDEADNAAAVRQEWKA